MSHQTDGSGGSGVFQPWSLSEHSRGVGLLVPLPQAGDPEGFGSTLLATFGGQSRHVFLETSQSCRQTCKMFNSFIQPHLYVDFLFFSNFNLLHSPTWPLLARSLLLCKFLDQVVDADVFDVLLEFLVDLQRR